MSKKSTTTRIAPPRTARHTARASRNVAGANTPNEELVEDDGLRLANKLSHFNADFDIVDNGDGRGPSLVITDPTTGTHAYFGDVKEVLQGLLDKFA